MVSFPRNRGGRNRSPKVFSVISRMNQMWINFLIKARKYENLYTN